MLSKAERQLVREKLYRIQSDIDPEIRIMVAELNEQGHLTLGSCAGHAGFGFVIFPAEDMNPETKQSIERIMHRHGIARVTWRNDMPIPCTDWGRQPVEDKSMHYAVFLPLVQPGPRRGFE